MFTFFLTIVRSHYAWTLNIYIEFTAVKLGNILHWLVFPKIKIFLDLNTSY
jgi:hypothetical protein